jgi:hypothetical protein
MSGQAIPWKKPLQSGQKRTLPTGDMLKTQQLQRDENCLLKRQKAGFTTQQLSHKKNGDCLHAVAVRQ